MTYSYEWRGNLTVFKLFCDREDFEIQFGKSTNFTRQSMDQSICKKWTIWKDAMVHRIMNFFIFEEEEHVQFNVYDRVLNYEVSFTCKPSNHLAFFCNCYVENFLTDYYILNPPDEPVKLHSSDLYCYETM